MDDEQLIDRLAREAFDAEERHHQSLDTWDTSPIYWEHADEEARESVRRMARTILAVLAKSERI